jgi:hypothetical protein
MGGHVFVASGEACPICEALAGLDVPPGYKPHANCNCNTIKSGEDCFFDYEVGEVWRAGSRFRATLSITVTCADGSVVEAPAITVDLETARGGDNDDILEDVAEESCEEYCQGEDDGDFLCC